MSHKLAFLAVFLQSSSVFAAPCSDVHRFCPVWANIGACQTNRDYMGRNCAKSCGCERINPPSDESSTTQTTTTITKTTEATTEAISTTEIVKTSESSGTSSSEDSTGTTVATTLSESSTEAESTAAATTETTTVTALPSTTTEVVTTRPSTPAPTCGQYLRKDNTDLAGVMLKLAWASRLDDCCSKCDKTVGCDGFSLYRRICYLKTRLQGTFPKASRTTFIRKQPVRPNQCSDFDATQANLDLAGILVKPPVYATEQEDCCNACVFVPECEGFSYFQGFCYLKGRLQGTYPKSGCTVQIKGSARRLLGDDISSGLWV